MSETSLKPLLVSGSTARRLLDVANTKYWELVKAGAIETVNVGGRKMVVYSSLERVAQHGARKAAA
ncbi:hypothetical protein [Acidocella sp.]|uniref:hypothetical protein n=1 Tax=Acidocella sp. TaxID=50710 RepID=UPI002633705C|nr:hypothetical protein [Acidocella sp.]